jgi:hypothetical protein
MHVLERKIADLAAASGDSQGRDQPFCRRVKSVWFNAWHYAEADLWASLIHHIFISLQGAPPAPRRILDEALAEVQGIKEARLVSVAQADEAHLDAERARAALNETVMEREKARQEATRVRGRDIWTAVTADETALEAFNEAAQMIGLPATGLNGREISQAVTDVSNVVDGGRLLVATAGRWRSPLVLGLGIGLLISAAGVLAAAKIGWGRSWLAPALASISQVAAICSGAAVWITRQASVVRQLLQPAETIKRQINERLAKAQEIHQADMLAAQERLDRAMTQLAKAQDAVEAAEAREVAAKAALDDLTGSRMLERYLSDRIESGDYNRYLGAVALAHRDLRDLDAFLRSAAAGGGQHAERIILYIDDLDRCSPKTVVNVLEAVHLLLALPLFVVVVGVDARWLARALSAEHPLLLPSGAPAAGDAYRSATSADYLDKIFQLTYELPQMTPNQCAELLTHTARQAQPDEPTGPARGTPQPHAANAVDTNPARRQQEDSPALGQGNPDVLAAMLALDPQEMQLLKALAPLVGTSPRRAKRFVNIYRVIKARVQADARTRERLAEEGAADLMLLTALVVGLPDAVPRTIESATEDLAVRSWLDNQITSETNGAEAARLASFSVASGDLAEAPLSKLQQWIPIVRPYAWPPTAGLNSVGSMQAIGTDPAASTDSPANSD